MRKYVLAFNGNFDNGCSFGFNEFPYVSVFDSEGKKQAIEDVRNFIVKDTKDFLKLNLKSIKGLTYKTKLITYENEKFIGEHMFRIDPLKLKNF